QLGHLPYYASKRTMSLIFHLSPINGSAPLVPGCNDSNNHAGRLRHDVKDLFNRWEARNERAFAAARDMPKDDATSLFDNSLRQRTSAISRNRDQVRGPPF